MRVTENLIAMNFVRHSAAALSRMATAQEQLASGRSLLRPSDDPAALSKSLGLHTELRRVAAYSDNASAATTFMSMTESSLQEVSDLLSRAKELMLAGQNEPSEGTGADAQASELRSLIESLLLVANRDVAGRALFGGRDTAGAPYRQLGGTIVYTGDAGEIQEQLGNGLRVSMNVPGPSAFHTVTSTIRGDVDLDPAISRITSLSDLFDGRGAVPSAIRITDGNGVTAEVGLAGATTLGNVIDAINAAGTGVVAGLAADGRSLELTDTSGGGSLQVEDVAGGGFASALGIASSSDTGTLTGVDLNPAVTENTAIALLRNGQGLATDRWTLSTERDGVTRTAGIDPSRANTLGDLLDLIRDARTADGESLGLRASIDGRNLRIESTAPQTSIAVEDAGLPGGAGQLGVAGVGRSIDVFELLEKAAVAIEARDNDAIDDAIRDVTGAIERTAGLRGTYGARARQVLALAESLHDEHVDLTIRLSDVEDADLAQVAIELQQAQTVYNASLAAGSRMLELSLFNYIR